MEGDILVGNDQLVRAFARWDREFRENPLAFRSTLVRILKGESSDEYGQACAAHLKTLLVEVR